MSSSIPAFYRTWFTIIDPPLTLFGVFGNIFAPAFILNGYTPTYVFPPATETTVLLYAAAGFFAGVLLLQAVLLRAKPNDLIVWRMVQMSILLVDIGMLAGLATALRVEGRMGLSNWRFEEYMNIGITAWVAILRLAFLLDVGMPSGKKRKSPSRKKA